MSRLGTARPGTLFVLIFYYESSLQRLSANLQKTTQPRSVRAYGLFISDTVYVAELAVVGCNLQYSVYEVATAPARIPELDTELVRMTGRAASRPLVASQPVPCSCARSPISSTLHLHRHQLHLTTLVCHGP